MASSEVEICNLAIGRTGQSIFINSLTEASQAANVCNVFFKPTRDAVLSAFPWNFATARATLADLGTPPTNWAYRYALPADCLTVRHLVVDGIREPLAHERIAFEIAEEGDVRVLYTDCANAELVYTRRITNPNLFSPTFVSALGWLLASEIALPLTSAPGVADRALRMYVTVLGTAQALALNERQGDPERDCAFLTGRN